jgi:hypothetical protein
LLKKGEPSTVPLPDLLLLVQFTQTNHVHLHHPPPIFRCHLSVGGALNAPYGHW